MDIEVVGTNHNKAYIGAEVPGARKLAQTRTANGIYMRILGANDIDRNPDEKRIDGGAAARAARPLGDAPVLRGVERALRVGRQLVRAAASPLWRPRRVPHERGRRVVGEGVQGGGAAEHR